MICFVSHVHANNAKIEAEVQLIQKMYTVKRKQTDGRTETANG